MILQVPSCMQIQQLAHESWMQFHHSYTSLSQADCLNQKFPAKINPFNTLYSGYLLGIFHFKGLLRARGPPSQGFSHHVPYD